METAGGSEVRRRQVETINGERKGKAKTQGGETWLRTEGKE